MGTVLEWNEEQEIIRNNTMELKLFVDEDGHDFTIIKGSALHPLMHKGDRLSRQMLRLVIMEGARIIINPCG